MRTAIFIGVAIAVYFFLKRFFGNWKGDVSDERNQSLAFGALVLLAVLYFGTPEWGTKIPGGLFERDEYEGYFFVHAYPGDDTVKSYRLPAYIQSVSERDTDLDGRSTYWRAYRLDHILMPNGYKLTFYNCDEPLYLNGLASLWDDEGNYWTITLTDAPCMRTGEGSAK